MTSIRDGYRTPTTAALNPEGVTLGTLGCVVFLSTMAALFGEETVFGYKLTGWGWVIPLCFCSILLAFRGPQASFPLKLWAAWLSIVATYFVLSKGVAVHRSVQMITPLVVGLAASAMRPTEGQLESFLKYTKWLAGGLWAAVLVKTGIALSTPLPDWLPLPAEVMTATLLACIFAAGYTLGRRTDLLWWLAMVAVPLFAVTRTAIVAAILTLPLSLSRIRARARVCLLALASVIGTVMLLSPRVQAKMFQSGVGTVLDTPIEELETNGRLFMWEAFAAGVLESPWFGHGAGAGEGFTNIITDGEQAYPHNDWLLTAYDYGIVGSIVYAMTLVGVMIHATRRARSSAGSVKVLFSAGASAFIPYAMLMMTDNIMVYSAFFGNLQLMFLGLAYGSMRLQTNAKHYS